MSDKIRLPSANQWGALDCESVHSQNKIRWPRKVKKLKRLIGRSVVHGQHSGGGGVPVHFLRRSPPQGIGTGIGMSPGAVQVWFHRLYSSLAGSSSHSGRRTFVTRRAKNIIAAGGSLRDVQELAGHSPLAATQRYIAAAGLAYGRRPYGRSERKWPAFPPAEDSIISLIERYAIRACVSIQRPKEKAGVFRRPRSSSSESNPTPFAHLSEA
jgi:hypothetical protein